ncbi:MAG TPA: alpha-(1-_3)-arabinofuranosyltransferase family protein [Mycobacteriales bacterium]|nr:alpha-(1->3)-arabinofuranosyltransferase family protein [Mycobacteriales bacterium]
MSATEVELPALAPSRAEGVDPAGAGPGNRWPAVPRPSPRATLIAVLVLLLAAVVFGNSAREFAADAKPELYFAPWRSAGAYLSAWQENPQLGFPSFNVGLVPVAVLIGLIQAVGFSPLLSVRVLRLLLLVLGGWGAARLYRAVRPDRERDDAGPLVAGIAFVANPYLVVAGGTQAILLPWALLPWQLLFLVRALRQPAETAGWRSRQPGGTVDRPSRQPGGTVDRPSRQPAGTAGWRLRLGNYRWPAAVALTFFAMTGMNAGVVPLLQLLAVPVIVLALRRADGLRWRQILAVLARCAALVVAVSAYWLVPSLFALRAGTVVVDNSETLEGIFGPTSYAEALRGLGQWPLYGSGPNGAWLPQYAAYLRNPVVVVLSFGLPVAAGLAALVVRGPVRRVGLALLAIAVPIMVGLFPPAAPSPFGQALRWGFDHVPGAGAFRTTNKIGALLVLGTALLLAALAAAAFRRTSGKAPRYRAAVVLALVALLAGGTVPAWTGRLYSSTVDVPDYWTQAATDLNTGPADERVWFIPGEVLAAYRWSQDRPDDLSTSLLSRPSLVRTVIPVTSPAAANLLAATDVQLNEGSLPPGALSATARYLGIGDVLLRNDVNWEVYQGGRPQVMQDQVNVDTGLRPLGNYGAPGQNTISAQYPPSTPLEASLPPLQRYAVSQPRSVTRTEPAAGTVLIDGDGFAVAPLVAAGLLAGQPAFRYLSDLTPAEFGRLLDRQVAGTGRVVLTDTNRRRATVGGRLGNSQGPLLGAGTDPGPTRALAGPDEQTVLRVQGGQATASEVGSAFGTVANAAAENAVDGNPNTAWRFGDFGRAVGQTLTLRTDSVQPVPAVTVHVAQTSGVRISRLRVTVGRTAVDVDVDATGTATVTLDQPVSTDTVKITVTGTRGDGFNLVGIAEVDVPGLRLARVARLPQTLARLASGLDGTGQAALDRTPVDVVLTRVRGTGATDDDEETSLARDFDLPVDRDYRLYGIIRPSTLNERDLDVLAGAGDGVTASTTSRAFDLPTLRGSQAVDGDPDTAWVPGAPVIGQSLTIEAGARVIDHVDVTQSAADRKPLADWVTKVRLSVDGRPGLIRDVGPGTTRLSFTPLIGHQLKLTILASHTGSPIAPLRISEVDFGGARITGDKARAAKACVPVGILDGQDLMMRPVLPITSMGPAVWAGCGRQSLAAGVHTVRPLGSWTPDELVLRDARGDNPPRPAQPPEVTIAHSRGPAMTVTVRSATDPYYLVTGQAYDPRWQATLDGRELGPPITVDGYSAGWLIDAPGTHTIAVRYGPQRTTDLALAGSGLTVLGCLVLLVLRAPPPAAAQVRRRLPVRAGRGRAAAVAGWVLLVGLGWLFGGLVLGAAVLVLAGWHLLRPPRPRLLLLAGVAVLAAVPIVWLVLRPDLNRPLTARLILDDLWPHRLAAIGLLLVLLGAARAERDIDRTEPAR